MADKEKVVHLLRPQSGAVQFTAKPVIVKVGRPATVFHVNEDRLIESSEFFKAALKKEWPSGRNRVVELPEEDQYTFNVYLNWIYSRQLFLGVNDGESRMADTSLARIIDAYILGDVLIDVDFKDAAVDAFLVDSLTLGENGKCLVPGTDTRKKVYERTPQGSKLRELLVYRFTRNGCPDLLREQDCQEFLIDVARKLAKQKEEKAESALVAAEECRFHEHAEGDENCYRTKYAKPTFMDLSHWWSIRRMHM